MKLSSSVKILLIASILLAPIGAYAQGSCSPDKIALKDTGRPAGGASIRVCPAGGTFPSCSASLFTDPTLGTPLGSSPVVTADALGNWGFCAAAGVNYDYQITCSGCTTLTVHNFPLPAITPITAAAVTSATANPATVGTIKLASGDIVDWRNNANTGNVQLAKTGAAAGGVPADSLDATAFGSIYNIKIILPTGALTLPATIVNDGAGGIIVAPNAGSAFQWQFGNSGVLQSPKGAGVVFQGLTSGSTQVLASAVAGSTAITIPAVTDTLAVLGTFASPPALGNTTPAAVNATTLSATGAVTKVNNISAAGFGVCPEVATVSSTAQTASIATTTLLATGASPGAGFYFVFGDIITTTAGTGGTASVTFTWNNGGTTINTTIPTISLASAGAEGGLSANVQSFFAAGATNIQYATTVTGATGSPQYALRLRLFYCGN